MRLFGVLLVAAMLQACGTIGGAITGAGDDLKTVGGYVKKAGS